MTSLKRHKKDARVFFIRLKHQPRFLHLVFNSPWTNQRKEKFIINFTVASCVKYMHD